ncbi:MAG: hypothetical protein PHV28_12210 [Kiritimatiellae bacterium]|nr:hypothetical protein [Kiritimatiellia bacterium]
MAVRKSISILVLLFVTVGVVAVALIAFTKRSPVALRIGDWGNGVSRYEFTCPQGTAFRLLLGLTGEASSVAQEVRGTISVMEEGVPVLQSEITPNDITRTSWLSRQGLIGLLVTGYTNNLAEAFRNLQPGKKVLIEIALTPEPPLKSSVWLYYLK